MFLYARCSDLELLCVYIKANFFEYMEVVADALVYFSGQQCYDEFTAAAESVAELAQQGAGSKGYQQLDKDFATCTPMGSSKDLSILLSDLMGNVQGTVQYNNEKAGVMNVTDICGTMTSDKSGSSAYDRFVTLSAQYREYYGQTCEDASWEDSVQYLANPAYDPANNMRPWTYQTCNEVITTLLISILLPLARLLYNFLCSSVTTKLPILLASLGTLGNNWIWIFTAHCATKVLMAGRLTHRLRG